MKYYISLPITALIAFSAINLLIFYDVIPPGLQLLEQLQGQLGNSFYLLLMLIILAESIVYVGFYFPGQFFAVLLVISAKPDWTDISVLTLAMVTAATLGSAINYGLGRFKSSDAHDTSSTKLKHLLLAMIHMNSLAFFMFSQGLNHRPFKIVLLAGLLNLPYYLLLIAITAFLSEEVMQIAENTVLLYSLLTLWLIVAGALDIKRRQH
jgi:membrane-associated protein